MPESFRDQPSASVQKCHRGIIVSRDEDEVPGHLPVVNPYASHESHSGFAHVRSQ